MALTGTMPDALAEAMNQAALRNEAVGYKIWGLVSHVTFFFLIWVGRRYRKALVVVVAIVALLLSLGYHVCLSWDVCMGITLEMARRNDHLSAQLCIILVFYLVSQLHDNDTNPDVAATVLAAEERMQLAEAGTLDAEVADRDDGDVGGPLNPPMYQLGWREIWLFVAIVVAALVTYSWPLDDSIFPFYIVFLASLAGWLIYVILRIERPQQSTSRMFLLGASQLAWWFVVAFFVFGILGIGFFLMPETTTSLFHSNWHFIIPLALAALVFAKECVPIDPLYLMHAIPLPERT